MKLSRNDEALITRYADGVLTGDALADFERRLLADPALRAAAEAQRETHGWLGRARDAEDRNAKGSDANSRRDSVAPGFAGAVLAATRRLPSREELQAEIDPFVERELSHTARTARMLCIAAAVIFGMSLLTWGGLLQDSDPQHLEASDEDRIREIDHAIQQDALRRASERPR